MAWAGLGTRPQRLGFKTGKRSGMAAPNTPKTDQERSVPAAENRASESGKKKALAELWQGPFQGLDWAGLGWGAGLKWAGLPPKA